ncbi:MAG: hypothetical protein OT477_13335 [Chloroflexi bacterium]|nr:hypothetical protein [Chloroflexota bacterium]
MEDIRPYLALVKMTPKRQRELAERIARLLQQDLQRERERRRISRK